MGKHSILPCALFLFRVFVLLTAVSFCYANTAAPATQAFSGNELSTDDNPVGGDLGKTGSEEHYEEEKFKAFKKPFFDKPFPIFKKLIPKPISFVKKSEPLPIFKKPIPKPIPIVKKPEPLPIPEFKKHILKPIPEFKKPILKPIPIVEKPESLPISEFKKSIPIVKKPEPLLIPESKKPIPKPFPIVEKSKPLPIPEFKKPILKPIPIVKKPFPKPFPIPKKPFLPPLVPAAIPESPSCLKIPTSISKAIIYIWLPFHD